MKLPTISLNDGYKIPVLGFGPATVGYRPNKMVKHDFLNRLYRKYVQHPLDVVRYESAVTKAFNMGYTLVDNSSSYHNDKHILTSITRSKYRREDFYLTSRVSNIAQKQSNVRDELFKTLKDLNTEYIDLYQFHWPVTDCYLNTWIEMIKLQKEGYVRSIGVANCNMHHIERILQLSDVTPSVNQFEIHPLFTQKELIAYCKNLGIVVQAYTPIARFDDRLMRLPLLHKLSKKYNKTIVQVILRWHIQNGVIPITRSLNLKRQSENISIFDFSLTDAEMQAIDSININSRLRYDPDNCDFSIL